MTNQERMEQIVARATKYNLKVVPRRDQDRVLDLRAEGARGQVAQLLKNDDGVAWVNDGEWAPLCRLPNGNCLVLLPESVLDSISDHVIDTTDTGMELTFHLGPLLHSSIGIPYNFRNLPSFNKVVGKAVLVEVKAK